MRTARVLLPLLALLACGAPDAIDEPAASPAEPVASPTPEIATPEAAPEPQTTPRRDRKRWLGISVANMREPIAGAPEGARAMIQRTFRGGPAHRAGLRHGDVIVKAAGAEVSRYQDYLDEARKLEIGDSLDLRVLRDGEPLDVSLRVVEQPTDMKRWRREHFAGTSAFPWKAEPLRGTGVFSSDEAAGRPQLLYFWATWCSNCRSVEPLIAELHRDAGDRLVLVAISSEEEAELLPWLEADDGSWPVGRDIEGRARLDYEVKSLPTACLLDGAGTVVAWDYGVGGVRRVVDRTRELLTPSR